MTAIKGTGGILSVASALSGSALTITAATQASPCVVTVTNALTAPVIAAIQGILGMTNLNNRAFNCSPVTGSNVTLKGLDSTAYGAYVSGGTLQAYTMEAVANVRDIKGFEGQTGEIDVTNLASAAKEYTPGLQDFGTVDCNLWLTTGDVTQAKLRALKESGTIWPFSVTLSDGSVSAFMGFVKQFGFDGVKPDGAVGSPLVIRVTNQPQWFA